MGAQIGGLRIFADHACKNKTHNQYAHDIRAPCGVLRVFYPHAQAAADNKPQLF